MSVSPWATNSHINLSLKKDIATSTTVKSWSLRQPWEAIDSNPHAPSDR